MLGRNRAHGIDQRLHPVRAVQVAKISVEHRPRLPDAGRRRARAPYGRMRVLQMQARHRDRVLARGRRTVRDVFAAERRRVTGIQLLELRPVFDREVVALVARHVDAVVADDLVGAVHLIDEQAAAGHRIEQLRLLREEADRNDAGINRDQEAQPLGHRHPGGGLDQRILADHERAEIAVAIELDRDFARTHQVRHVLPVRAPWIRTVVRIEIPHQLDWFRHDLSSRPRHLTKIPGRRSMEISPQATSSRQPYRLRATTIRHCGNACSIPSCGATAPSNSEAPTRLV